MAGAIWASGYTLLPPQRILSNVSHLYRGFEYDQSNLCGGRVLTETLSTFMEVKDTDLSNQPQSYKYV